MVRRHLVGILLAVSLVAAFATPALADGGHGSSSSAASSSSEQGQKTHGSEGTALRGVITAASATAITIGGQTVAIGPSTVIRFHDKVVAPGAIPTGVPAVAKVDATGSALEVTLLQDPNIPKGESYQGVIAAVYGTSITIGQYTLTISPSAQVKYGDRSIPLAAIPTGVRAKVSLSRSNVVTGVKLFSDPNIPKGESYQGVIGAVYGDSITVGQYTLALSSQVVVQYHGFRLPASAIPLGVQAKVKIGRDLTVTKVKLEADPNLPRSKGLRGTVSTVGTATITVDGYTLPVDPGAVISYRGSPYALSAIQAGWDVKLHLSSSGTVVEIKIKQGPQQQGSSSDN